MAIAIERWQRRTQSVDRHISAKSTRAFEWTRRLVKRKLLFTRPTQDIHLGGRHVPVCQPVIRTHVVCTHKTHHQIFANSIFCFADLGASPITRGHATSCSSRFAAHVCLLELTVGRQLKYRRALGRAHTSVTPHWNRSTENTDLTIALIFVLRVRSCAKSDFERMFLEETRS